MLARRSTFGPVSVVALLVTLPVAARSFDDHVFVATGDGFSPGNCAAFDPEPPWPSTTDLEELGASPHVRHFLGLHFVVDRSLGGEIQVVDPATFDTVVRFTPGGTPHDILVANASSAWVTRYESPWLLKVNPATGAPLDSVDLGIFADADGAPEMSMMARDGDHLFVQIQRRDFVNGPPFLPGLLAVVDLTTGTLVDADPANAGIQGIALAGMWPEHRMHVDSAARRLYVSTPGPRLDVSGGIEEIDLDSLTRLGFLVSEATASADLGGFVIVAPDKGYVIGHTDIIPSSHLSPFSRPDGTLSFEIHTGLGFFIDNLAFDAPTGQLFFPDPADGGVHVFDVASDVRLTVTAVPTGGAPIDVMVARDGAVGAPVLPVGAASDRLSWAFPNPAPAGVSFGLARRADRVRLTVRDVRGAVVRTLEGPPLRWDGRDRHGRPAVAGVYFYRIQGDLSDTGRFVLLR